MDRTGTLHDIDPFKQLPEMVVAELEAAATLVTYPPRVEVFRQHDHPTGFLYVIQRGLIEIVAQEPGGVEMVVDYRRPGSFFGGTPFLSNEPYTAGARAVSETVCYLIPDRLLTTIAQQYPELIAHFTRSILTRVRSLYREMVSEQARGTLVQVEAYPFQKRLSEIMRPDVVCCSPETTVQEVASLMLQNNVDAVLVQNLADQTCGIITEHDLVAKILASSASKNVSSLAREVMTSSPLTMPADAYMYEAAAFMIRHQIKHLPVQDGSRIVGLLTLRDLMEYRSLDSLLLVGGIQEAQSLDVLTKAKQELGNIAKAFMNEARSPIEIMELLSYLHHSILRRGFELVLEQMQAQGNTLPGVHYCFFLLGSGGRREMLLDPDQDSGLVLADYPDKRHREIEAFFVPFTAKLVAAFEQIGYPPCKGGVMPTNPRWRGRLKDWKQRLTSWISVPEPQRIRYSNNFFDFMPLAGDPQLCTELRLLTQRQIQTTPLFLYQLMELNFGHKVPLGLMGGFVLDKEGEFQGKVPTKQTGSLFIVDCLRIFSLEQQLNVTSTTERLEALVSRHIFNQETAEHLKAAFQAFIFLRLREEIARLEQGQVPTHYLDPNSLSKSEQDLLKEAFRAASKLQDATRRHFSRLVN